MRKVLTRRVLFRLPSRIACSAHGSADKIPVRMRFTGRLKRHSILPIFALAVALLFPYRAQPQPSQAAPVRRADLLNVYGTNFTLSVPNVDPGQYTAIFGFVETEATGAGQRGFDILSADRVVASNLDVFSAGGAGKPYFISVPVTHDEDLAVGPISFTFIGRKGLAMVNSLELKSALGARVFLLKAADMMNSDDVAAMTLPEVPGPVLWKDPAKSLDVRVQDLISRMSLAEKVSQLRNGTAPIFRLGVPAYDYWSECLHGIGRAGIATVFPQTIGMAATWDTPLIHQVADTISTEARAKHNLYSQLHDGDSIRYEGLTFWTPNINIFRDPRWGRGQETYGEDPFLTGEMAVAFIRGLQGDDPKYIKAMACAKHFVVHSGPEPARHGFNAEPPERDLFETYLPAFEAAVRRGHVGAIMGAYNALNGEPCCSNPALLTGLLRDTWGFDGHVVSDCGAVEDIFEGHHLTANPELATVRALKAGCDLCCGTNYNGLVHSVRKGLVEEKQLDIALKRVLMARFRLGLFDPPEMVPYSKIPITENDTPDHAELALQTARESIVLLKNDGLLPLQRAKIKHILVLGLNAPSVPVLLGNYNGEPSAPITILDGIKNVAGKEIEVSYAPGCSLAWRSGVMNRDDVIAVSNAVTMARSADVVIYVGGLNSNLEREEAPIDFDGFFGGDRTKIELTTPQTELLKAMQSTGKPVVFINCSGSAVAMPWEAANLPAIVQAWYPGEAGGTAVGEVLFGDTNPGGRLPVTFYGSTADLPSFEDYSMVGRTYRYFKGTAEFAFGHGLSYTKFEYGTPALESAKMPAGGTLKLSLQITNSGVRDGDEVAQVYFRHVDSKLPQAKEALCGFTRVHIAKKESAKVPLEIPVERLRYWSTAEKRYIVEPGKYELLIGAGSDDIRVR